MCTISDAARSASRPPGFGGVCNSLATAASSSCHTVSALQCTQATFTLSASTHQRAGSSRPAPQRNSHFTTHASTKPAAASTSCTRMPQRQCCSAGARRLGNIHKRRASQGAAAARQPVPPHAPATKLAGSIWHHLAAPHTLSVNHTTPATACVRPLLQHRLFPAAAEGRTCRAACRPADGGRSCRPAFTDVCWCRRSIMLPVYQGRQSSNTCASPGACSRTLLVILSSPSKRHPAKVLRPGSHCRRSNQLRKQAGSPSKHNRRSAMHRPAAHLGRSSRCCKNWLFQLTCATQREGSMHCQQLQQRQVATATTTIDTLHNSTAIPSDRMQCRQRDPELRAATRAAHTKPKSPQQHTCVAACDEIHCLQLPVSAASSTVPAQQGA